MLREPRIKEFREMWSDANKSVDEIADEFGLSVLGCIQKAERLRARGIPMPRRRM